MKDKILKEAINWFEQHNDKNNMFIEDFIDMLVDKTTTALFEEVNNSLKEEFEKGNLKHPFIISNDYYLYLKLKEIKSKCYTKKINETKETKENKEKLN